MLKGLYIAREEFRQALSWFLIHMVEAHGCYYVSMYVLLFVFDSSVLSEQYFLLLKIVSLKFFAFMVMMISLIDSET